MVGVLRKASRPAEAQVQHAEKLDNNHAEFEKEIAIMARDGKTLLPEDAESQSSSEFRA